ncbi:MAG TPA: efflux RND transporter permease subunit [Acidimicrobiales bacterium]|nr:efflux RND transporter permease subunit [Acidimicrobiales bacterium]
MLVAVVTFFARRARLTLALWAVLLVFGVVSYTTLLPREGFPAVDVPVAVVSGPYFVDDPEQVDTEVVVPLTAVIEQVEGVDSVTSFARPSSFAVLTEFSGDLTSVDGAVLLRDAIASAEGLPDDLLVDVQAIDAARFLNSFDLLVGVTGPDGATAADLDAAADGLATALATVDGVDRVEAQPLEEEGVDGDGQPVVRQTSFNSLAVTTGEGLDFRPSVSIGVRGVDGIDQITLSDRVDDALTNATASGALPDGYTAVIAADFAGQIRSQLASLQSNALIGVLAVVLATLVLISWRASFIAALFVVTVLATVMGILYLFGISLNTISLFGVILSLGLFVDDAVVVGEAVDAFKQRGASAIDTIRGAIRRVGTATISGTLTTILVFMPLLFITGVLGDFIRQLPITVIIGLSVSLVLSLVLIPTAARVLILNGEHRPSPLHRIEQRVGDFVASLPAQLRSEHRWRGRLIAAGGVGLSIAAVMGGGFFAGKVGFDIFPQASDADVIVVDLAFDPGTPIDQATEITDEVDRIVADELGDLLVGGFLFDGSEASATSQYELVSFRDRNVTAPELVDRLEPRLAEVDGARISVEQVSQGPPRSQFPFQAQVYGEDVAAVATLADAIAADLDGEELTLAGGATATVVETVVELDDVVARSDGRRYVEVRARFDVDDVSSTTAAAQSWVEDRFTADVLADTYGLPADTLEFDLGIESDNAESFGSTVTAFVVALVLMFVLLVIQFRSLLQPLLVFLAIPFTFLGVFGGLWLTGNPISFLVTLGLIGLIGIAVNNTILLTDFANQERRAGADRVTAIATAARLRFRALVTTSVTTMAGLLPLALTDPFWEPLAFTIVFGLMSSTVLVLLAFPYYYLGIEWLRDGIRARNPLRRRPGLDPDDAGGSGGDPDDTPAPTPAAAPV